MHPRSTPPDNLPVVDDDLTPMEPEILQPSEVEFSDAELERFMRYFECLRQIVERLVTCEGYRFQDGELIPPADPSDVGDD